MSVGNLTSDVVTVGAAAAGVAVASTPIGKRKGHEWNAALT